MKLTVFTKPGCVQCGGTFRKLAKLNASHGITHTARDISVDPEGYTYVVESLGYTQVPVVLVEHEDGTVEHWSGNRPDKLDALAASLSTV